MFVIVLIGIQLIMNIRFREVSTDPPTSEVSIISPFLEINFNKELSKQKLTISSTRGLVKSYKLSGKIISLNLNSPTVASKTYYITIARVYDIKNNTIKNLKIKYTAQNIAFQNLPKDQQRVILNNQAPIQEVVFNNSNALVNYGITTNQLSQIEAYILQYKSSAKTITFETNSFTDNEINTSQGSIFSVGYSVDIDGIIYKASDEYLGNSINLSLYNQNGSLVFNEGSY
jgi:hypothetical protein